MSLKILLILGTLHLFNDFLQAVVPALYPHLKQTLSLSFKAIGGLAFTYQFSASLFQPLIGLYIDKRPRKYGLLFSISLSALGLILLACSKNYFFLMIGMACIGSGSALFHPEASRLTRLVASEQPGFAQSLFQLGGNVGTCLGPLAGALFLSRPDSGQTSLIWFLGVSALSATLFLKFLSLSTSSLFSPPSCSEKETNSSPFQSVPSTLLSKKKFYGLAILLILICGKHLYLASMTNYYVFYLIEKFSLSIPSAQIHLFIFWAAIAVGTFAGGLLSDRIGYRRVISLSLLGALPWTLALPYASLFWIPLLTILAGLMLASAFSSILVYGQTLLPGRVGFVSGLFFGTSFAIGGVGAFFLGVLADMHSIILVFHLSSFLPAVGLLTYLLPSPRRANF